MNPADVLSLLGKVEFVHAQSLLPDAREGWECLLAGVAMEESSLDPTKVSGKGAQGLMQLMPGTARDLGVDPMDPRSAADGAARYLLELYREFRCWTFVLAAYNWGPGNLGRALVVRHPLPIETDNYVRRVFGYQSIFRGVRVPTSAAGSIA